MLPQRRQGLLRERLQRRVASVLRLLLEQRDVLVVILDHRRHVFAIERGAFELLQLRDHRLMLRLHLFLRRQHQALVAGDLRQFRVPLRMIGDHPRREFLHLGVRRLRRCEPAQFDFEHAAFSGGHGEAAVGVGGSLQRLLTAGASVVPLRNRIGFGRQARIGWRLASGLRRQSRRRRRVLRERHLRSECQKAGDDDELRHGSLLGRVEATAAPDPTRPSR